MKKAIWAGAALLAMTGCVTTAHAGGDVVSGGYDWSGFNAGVSAGALLSGVTTETSLSVPGPAPWLHSSSASAQGDDAAFTGGVSLGYDWQFDRLVLGIETDVNFGGLDGDQTVRYTNAFGVNGDTGTQRLSYSSDWYGTLRGRLGFAADNMLFYGTAGIAYSTLETDNSLSVTRGSSTTKLIDDHTDWLVGGWTAGAGVEYGFDKWSLGAEYLYVSLPVDTSKSSGSIKASGDVDYGFSVVRATAKLRF